jgi:hypothetical protein
METLLRTYSDRDSGPLPSNISVYAGRGGFRQPVIRLISTFVS